MRNYRMVAIVMTLLAVIVSGSALLADEPVVERPGRAEVRFLEGMIDHHQMALDMASDCLTKAESEPVRTLCQNVITAQSREILTMRGWLLSWYAIDYEPVSMLHADHEEAPAQGMAPGGMGMGMMQQGGMGMMGGEMGMMGDMAGMMAQMAEMMANMSGMMGGEMGMGMMPDGMGMGMMQQGGMGMMGGGMAAGTAMPDMPMGAMLHALGVMNSMTVGEFLERAAALEDGTPLLDAIAQIAAEQDPAAMFDMGMMGTMTPGQMMAMFGEMGSLTLADIGEMQGHLDDGANATLMALMQHHMEVMAGDGAAQAAPAQGGDHEAHHPEGAAAQGGAPQGSPGQDHSEHSGAAAALAPADPAMTMGMFAGLNALSGVAYEIAWLEAMIDHHDDAIHMSERILERAPEEVGHESLRTLAERIISDQSAEIEAMEALIAELGG